MKRIFGFWLMVLVCAYAGELKVAAGAGYKAPMMEIIAGFEKVSSHKIYGIFGNMKQVSTQASDGGIALVLGDKAYLSKKSGLSFINYTDVGVGKPVLAYPKGKPLEKLEDIATDKVKKIVMPQPKKAIYGTAAAQILENSGLKEQVGSKIYEVATVPQSATYVLTNEVDAGFINLTAALAHGDKIGGYIQIEPNLYEPIIITVGKLSPCEGDVCKEFLDYLQTPVAKAVFKKYGL